MEIQAVQREITTLERVLFDADHRVISDDCRDIFQRILSQLYATRPGIKWEINVLRDNPIKFVPCPKDTNYLEVDLFGCMGECDLNSKGYGSAFSGLFGSWTLRLWSKVEKHYHRPGIDCIQIRNKIEGSDLLRGRVLARFHFDSSMTEAHEPAYHFHVGGKYRDDDEFCWHPDWLKVPRFVHHPLNLILICEFVIANFFPDHYQTICQEPTWEDALLKAQDEFVFPYFELICSSKDHRRSLLRLLCEPS